MLYSLHVSGINFTHLQERLLHRRVVGITTGNMIYCALVYYFLLVVGSSSVWEVVQLQYL
jgi:hypothetical protein